MEGGMSEKGIILEIKTGSQLYGTSTPESDTDYLGVFIPTYEELLRKVGGIKEMDLSIKSKGEDGKNCKDAVDRKFYALRNFFNLAIGNNPNILEVLFVNESNLVYANEYGKMILNNRRLFPHKGLADRFIGYAKGQLHKMVIKGDNLNQMVDIVSYLEEHVDPKSVLVELMYDDSFMQMFSELKKITLGKINKDGSMDFTQNFMKIGDLNIPVSISIKDTIKRLKVRISKVGNRSDLVLKYGYDTKFAMHTVRLLTEAKMLLETGEIQYPLANSKFLLNIRNGEFNSAVIIAMTESLMREVDGLVPGSALRDKPNHTEVDMLFNTIISDLI